jgi:hypothetical protein
MKPLTSYKTNLLIYFLFLFTVNTLATNKLIENLVNKYEAIVDNIRYDDSNNMIAVREISTNQQIMIIPTANVMSSEEDYQFIKYFSKSNKEKLVGRLLIERFLGNESYYHVFIESLPKPDELLDYYHYSDKLKQEFNRRSLIKYIWQDRRSDFEDLTRKIPYNV